MIHSLKAKSILQEYLENHASVFYLQIDKQLNIVDSNAYTELILGFSPRQKTINDVFVDFSWQVDPEIQHTGVEQEKLFSINTFTGFPQSFYVSFHAVESGFVILGRTDIQENEQLRKQLLILNSELTNLTRELFKKNAELEQLNKLKNQFLGMAAHDLRKPAGIVQMFTELIIEEAGETLSEQHKEYLNYILTSGVSMVDIINDFLDASLIESGHFTINLQKCNIVEVVAENLKIHKLISSKRNTFIHLNHETDLPAIYIDKPKIDQVLNNIITNAIEYSPDNSTVNIEIGVETDCIAVSVSDNGPGIPEDVLATLFQPYTRGRLKKADKGISSGLGLSISKKIIDAHGGEIKGVSQVGNGTTFTFKLPLTK